MLNPGSQLKYMVIHGIVSEFCPSTCLYDCFQVARQLPDLCVTFHESVSALSQRFLSEQRRHYYVTPTSYLELLGSYKKLLARRQDEV